MKGLPAYVYVLIDPRTGQPRYVGSTVRPVERRLQDHLDQTRGERSTGVLKDNWIKELLANGHVPKIRRMLTADSLEDARKLEDEMILNLRKHGADLCNIGPGKYERKKPEEEEE